MRRKAFPYYILICIALMFLFIVSCGSQNGGAPLADSGGPNSESAGMRDAAGGFLSNAVQITSAVDDQSNSATAYDITSDVFFTVWTDARHQASRGKDIYGAFVNALDGTVMNPSGIPIAIGLDNQLQPDVAYNSDTNQFLVVYTNSGAAGVHIYGQFINAATYDS